MGKEEFGFEELEELRTSSTSFPSLSAMYVHSYVLAVVSAIRV